MNSKALKSRLLSRRQTMAGLLLLTTSAFLALGPLQAQAAADPLRVGIEEGRQLFESQQALLFDIRETDEHASGVANGAKLLPMSQLQQRANEIPSDPAQPVLIICNTQNRSSKVARALKKAGWNNVRYVHGGMSTWAEKGWPMVKPTGQQPLVTLKAF
jgi:rhodanese-related sulfurtransferase